MQTPGNFTAEEITLKFRSPCLRNPAIMSRTIPLGFFLGSRFDKSVKRKRNKSKQSPAAMRGKAQAAATASIPPGRLWCYRILAMLLPLAVLVLVELGLRVGGFGYPTAFFLNANDPGRTMLTDNPWFGWRFFPRAVARTPQPFYLAARKPPNTVRIFVFGESAAMGDPEPAYGFARQLERLLQARHPDQKIEVVNNAMTAINSHVIRLIARDCAPRQGDLWLVYAGNNEVIGPFGAGTVFGRQVPNLTLVRFVLALKTTRIGQLLAQITRGADAPKQWEGLEFFLKSQLTRDDPRLKRVYASFAANLGDIVDYGRRSGATVLLATVPVNLRDFPPLASVHRADLRPEQLADWQNFFSAGTNAQVAENFADALGDFRQAANIDDGFAELVFQRARCEEALQQAAPAEADFRLARDLDTLRFRADSRLNEIIRQTAEAKGIPEIDAGGELARHGDEDFFYDHVHLNFAGNYRMARLFAAEVEKHWPGGRTNGLPWLTQAEVARQLAFTAFDEARVAQEMRARLQRPPFNAQSNFRARDERWGAKIAALSAVPAAVCTSNYQAALALAPDDWVLHANFARWLMTIGDNSNAAIQCAEVTHLMPHSSEGWANRGRLARLAGEPGRAKNFLEEALKQEPDSVMVRTELGSLEADLGETESARREFRSALRLEPGFTEARINLGLLLANKGDVAGAAAEYREALRWETNSVEARVNLAILLSAHGQSGEALTLCEQAVALDPVNPIVRYNFARLLAAENRDAEAVTNFQVALRQPGGFTRPEVAEIHLETGNALARLGRDMEALAEFAEAVQLNPDLADAHLNYGAALARSGRYSEAAAEFRETLRLRPNDERAQRMLDQATDASRGGRNP